MNTFKFPLKRNIVWSPHFYPLSFAPSYFPENATRLEADLAAKYAKFVLELGTPIWIGEFGAFMKDDSHVDWLKDATRLFGKYQLGWAWWGFEDDAIRDTVSLSYLTLTTS
jgi:hypothetical protein